MLYDLSNPHHADQLRRRVEDAIGKGEGVVEYVERKPQRTMQQNKYLHLIIQLFASEYGETAEFVKEQYFKLAANRDIFLRHRNDKLAGIVTILRSSRDLTTDEMTKAIERFRDWSSANAGIYLPSADEHRLIEMAEVEVSRNKYI